MAPGVTQFTRTFGAQATAKLVVTLISPAFAAPYAATPGDGRVPLSDEMFRIDPPDSCSCITALAAWPDVHGSQQVELDDRLGEAGRRGGGVGRGRPAGVVHGDVEPAEPLDDLGHQSRRLLGVAHVGREERGARLLGFGPTAHHDLGAAPGVRRRDPLAHAPGPPGDEHDLAAEVDVDRLVHIHEGETLPTGPDPTVRRVERCTPPPTSRVPTTP